MSSTHDTNSPFEYVPYVYLHDFNTDYDDGNGLYQKEVI